MLINIPSTDSPHFKDQYLLARSTCWLTHSTQDYEEIKISEEYDYSVVEVPFVPGQSSEIGSYNFLDSLRNIIAKGGASFDSIAIKYSQDPGTAKNGGHLGYTSRGTLVQAFEEAAYSLESGEISLPIRSEFGYHLIRLIERRGEKISTQHILLSVSVSDNDRALALNQTKNIYTLSKNDPFVFDSIAVEYKNLYNNLSGTYLKMGRDNIPTVLLNGLVGASNYTLSAPVESSSGYLLIYIYEHRREVVPNLNNSWDLIYQMALQNKQMKTFQEFVNSQREKTFIKIFY